MAAPSDAGMPEALVVAEKYVIRIAALDPATGAEVAGVNIQTVVLTAERGDAGTIIVPGDEGGWLLVPGPSG